MNNAVFQDMQYPDNLYLVSVVKAMREFIQEECNGNISSDLRLMKKIESARLLFPEDRMNLRKILK
ncbi:MAG: hypothetical protein LBG96_02475 [Tannerella sp.]|jgi:hypothetical protein|nr:hypothetical protein [Tannerella sp.]